MLMCIQNLIRFCQIVPKIQSGNEILYNKTGNNPKLDRVNVDVYAKFGQIL